MNWTTKIELRYRVRVRQMQNTDDFFIPVLDGIKSIVGSTISWNAENLIEWPIKEQDVSEAEANGFIVSATKRGFCISIREYVISIPANNPGPVQELIGNILDECGHVFATIRIITEAFTDVAAQ